MVAKIRQVDLKFLGKIFSGEKSGFPKLLPDAGGGGGVGDRDFWLSGVWVLRGCVPEPATAAGGTGGWSPGPRGPRVFFFLVVS